MYLLPFNVHMIFFINTLLDYFWQTQAKLIIIDKLWMKMIIGFSLFVAVYLVFNLINPRKLSKIELEAKIIYDPKLIRIWDEWVPMYICVSVVHEIELCPDISPWTSIYTHGIKLQPSHTQFKENQYFLFIFFSISYTHSCNNLLCVTLNT